jgi:hypothetical protein
MPGQPHRTAPPGFRWSSNREADEPGTARRPRLLLICDYRPHEAATVIDHIEAIRQWSRNDVFVLPTFGDLPDELDLEAFDGLVIHYNVVMSVDAYLSPLARWRIAGFGGTKGAFIQDEYRFVNRTISVMRTLGINVLFTCVPQDQLALVYPDGTFPRLRRAVTVFTGYVPPDLLSRGIAPYELRPIDVGYRARRLPPWLGRLAMEKAQIADRFAGDAPGLGLAVDISTEEEGRMYGEPWLDFLSACKATLGSETGASVFDFDGSIEERIRGYQANHPDASFEDLHRLFLVDVDGRIRFDQISPRIFEAAALGTMMVLYPGRYAGALEPWRHYVPLEKDHSNMAQVVEAIRDRETWERMTARARVEVAENPRYSYQAMVEAMDEGLELTTTASRSLTARAFDSIASRSFARLPSTRMYAGGLPPAVNRVRRVPGRLVRWIAPSPTAILPISPGTEGRRRLRRDIRVARAFTYWSARPRTLPLSVLVAGGRSLLGELSELSAIQDHAKRAIDSRAGSPFVLVIDRPTGELRIKLRDHADGVADADPLPTDLTGATAFAIDLADPWLVPSGVRPERDRRLPALSAVLRDRPAVGRRLLAGVAPWCAVVVVSQPEPARPPERPAGADVA